MRSALIIVAKDGYQDMEYAGTRKGLEDAGFTIVIASTATGPCRGKFGGSIEATVALPDVVVRDYDRVAYIGGPGAGELWKNDDAKRIARDVVAAGKPLGAICIAPTILAAAGVLKNKRATVWNEDGEQQGFIESYGAVYTGEAVTGDGLIVTGNGPGAAEEFGRVLAAIQ